MSLLLLLALACVIYLLFNNKNKKPAARRAAASTAAVPYTLAPPAAEPACHWRDGGRYDTEVVVESAFQGAIRGLAGEHGERNADRTCQAVLLPDDLNPYDDKAVMVFVEGQAVGYLERADALLLRGKLGRKGVPGQPTSCDAKIRGGGLWQGKRLTYSVALDIPPTD